MIKFHKINQWGRQGEVKSIDIFTLAVAHCTCGCKESSAFITIMGFGVIITKSKK